MAFSDVEKYIEEAWGDAGWDAQPYLHILYECVIDSPPGTVIEIGSEAGYSSMALAQACKDCEKQFISIDPYPIFENGVWIYDPKRLHGTSEIYRKEVLGRFPESIQYNQDLLECIDKIPNILSCVFIDGFHDSTNTEREWNLLFPRIVSGGWIIMDDVGWTGNQSGIGTGGPAVTARRFLEPNVFGRIINAQDKGLQAGKKS